MSLAGCGSNPAKKDTGVVVDGVLGGIIGSQTEKGRGKTASTITGAMIGAMIGGSIGKHMDKQDRMKALNALEYKQDNQPTIWRNTNTGHRYSVTPTKTYMGTRGKYTEKYCREYTTKAIIAGNRKEVYGSACRKSDGSWEAIN